jgi:hypothetical protein
MSKMLSSWKEIAHFFGKGVRTVQRWEKTLDLPIHRPPGAPSNVVLARTSDLEEWMHRGPVSRGSEEMLSIDSEITLMGLDSLEREANHLAEIVGITPAEIEQGANAQDRVYAVTDVLGRARARIAAGKSGIRAA